MRAIGLALLVVLGGFAAVEPLDALQDSTAGAQETTPAASASVEDGGVVVHPDGRVTFARVAPEAEKVVLVREGGRPSELLRGDEGVWTLTTEPLEPDVYAYYYLIDGVPAGDPANPEILPVISGGGQGLVHVPGPESLIWEERDVPAGRVEVVEYESALIGEGRSLVVYLPPGYEAERVEGYPVLYLLHGVTLDEFAWTTAGRVQTILDNLLADGSLAEPMIVVMPLGYGFPDPATRAGNLMGAMDHRPWMDTFASSLVEEIIPLVEERFQARSEAAFRAVAGLSMGGAQALHAGANRPGVFGAVGGMSSAFMLYAGRYDELLGPLAEVPPEGRPRIWLTTGTQDFVVGANRQVAQWLEDAAVDASYEETQGGHTWMVWRRALARFAPTLFR